MSNSVVIPYDWIKIISPAQAELETVPRFGYPPNFPLEKLSSQFATYFEIKDFSLKASAPVWRTSEKEIVSGIGEPVEILSGNVASMEGTWSWIMSEHDVNLLMSLILTKKDQPLNIAEPEFNDGFYHYIALEAITLLGQLDFDKSIVPNLLIHKELPQSPAFCIDVTIKIGARQLASRFVISQELHRSLKEHYGERKTQLTLSPELAKSVTVTVHLEVGKTVVDLAEWKKAQTGDCLVLDHCSVDLEHEKSRVMLTVNGEALFRGKFKQGNIKILEIPQFYEAQTTMATQHPGDEEEHEDEFDISEFEDFEEEGDESELEYSEESKEHAATPPAHPPVAAETTEEAPAQEAAASTGVEVAPEEPATPFSNIPLTIVVEAGRLQMTVQKLMDLQAGNLLEVDIHPENGVDLVVNNKVIGKGEIVRLGDVLGVRILDLGK